MAGLAVDNNGNQYFAGSLYGTFDFGSNIATSAGDADLVVVKLDATTHAATWANPFGDSNGQFARGVAAGHSGQVGVIGHFSGSMVVKTGLTLSNSGDPIDFILGLNSSGAGVWGTSVDTRAGSLASIAGNPARDEFVVCGSTAPCTIDPNDPTTAACTGPMTDLGVVGHQNSDNLEDIVIAKLNATTGAVLWSSQIGGAGTQVCTAVALADDGTVYATGTYNGTLNFGGATTALPSPASASILAVWVAKFDSNGVGNAANALVAKNFGTVGKQGPKAIAVHTDSTSNTNVALAGYMTNSLAFGATTLTSAGKEDGFLARLDSTLTPQWATRWGDATYNQEAHSVAFSSAGDIVVAGLMTGTSIFSPAVTSGPTITVTSNGNLASDAFWAKFSSDGSPTCAAGFGDSAGQSADSVAISGAATGAQKDVISIGGSFSGTIDLGGGLPTITTPIANPAGYLLVLH
jgi:hypothetical protein